MVLVPVAECVVRRLLWLRGRDTKPLKVQLGRAICWAVLRPLFRPLAAVRRL